MTARFFFPRGLDPILDGGPRDKDAVVTPQMPTGHAIGEAVLDYQSHGGLLHPVGVMTLGRGQVGQISSKGTPTGPTAMRRVADMDVNRSSAEGVTEIMNGPGGHPPATSTPTTGGAAPAEVVATARLDAWLRKILDLGNPFCDIGQINAWSTHGSHLLTQ